MSERGMVSEGRGRTSLDGRGCLQARADAVRASGMCPFRGAGRKSRVLAPGFRCE